jgi:hypothetical protein
MFALEAEADSRYFAGSGGSEVRRERMMMDIGSQLANCSEYQTSKSSATRKHLDNRSLAFPFLPEEASLRSTRFGREQNNRLSIIYRIQCVKENQLDR